jgi:ligand-binding sensor domain-containing protein
MKPTALILALFLSAGALAADTAPPTQISQYIRRMLQDREGSIWFGTESDGVCRYDGRSLVYFTPADGLSGTAVRGMAQDARGTLWFATRGGVFTKADGLADDQVWSLLLDRAGGFWFGTEGGVSRFDGKTFTPFPLPAADLSRFPGAASNFVWTLHQDRRGAIWIATAGGGVCRYAAGKFTCYSQRDGLGNRYVQSILEDGRGQLWFGTSGGVYRFNGTAFTNFTKENAVGWMRQSH